MHRKVGSKFKGGLEGRGLETMEKTKWSNQEKEGNKVTDCFSRLSSDWFSRQKCHLMVFKPERFQVQWASSNDGKIKGSIERNL